MTERELIKDIKKEKRQKTIDVIGWVENKRDLGKLIILTLRDCSDKIIAIAKINVMRKETFLKLKKIKEESCIRINGVYNPHKKEIDIRDISCISLAEKVLSPKIGYSFKVFEEKYINNILKNRHVYIRNEKIASVLKLRSYFIQILHDFFHNNNFIEFTAPILTPITLYGEQSAFSVDFYGKKLYLTQCTAFYLETALPVFEKVYLISPSFRREKSRSRRHLSEFWHLKAEISFCNLNDIIKFVEEMLYFASKKLLGVGKKEIENLGCKIKISEFKPPYKKITYDKALSILNKKGFDLNWGKSLGSDEERFLGNIFKKPFWIKFLPRNIEPFPYKINPSDERTTLTADLIVPYAGEILGVAEKIYTKEELERRIKEDSVPHPLEVYDWYLELRELGMPPHSGFGMGIERTLRGLLKLKHVRDAIPYPRCVKQPYV